jgi:hypothetical protein
MKKVHRMLNFYTYKRLFCANFYIIAIIQAPKVRQNSVTPSGFTRSSAALHARKDLDLGVKNASMAHHLARRTKREKEHPMCGAAPLSPQFGAKVQKKLFSNKF